MWYHNIGELARFTNERVRFLCATEWPVQAPRPGGFATPGRDLPPAPYGAAADDRIHHSKKTERHCALSMFG
jgi:hypothetical protein